jgi:hypothetical protein
METGFETLYLLSPNPGAMLMSCAASYIPVSAARARKLGLDWVNWRSLRTSHATWLKLAGDDVKDARRRCGTRGRAPRWTSTCSSCRRPETGDRQTELSQHANRLKLRRNCSQLQSRTEMRDVRVIENMMAVNETFEVNSRLTG